MAGSQTPGSLPTVAAHRQRAAPGLHRVLRRARPHAGAVGQPHPARPHGAVHGGRHGAVQAVLRRRRDAAVQRATSVQKCARAGGKHNDLDDVGRTTRHLVFFEMLGNFSFGDYFKADAIPWSWELVTEVLGFDGDRIWVTVHTSDDEAEQIWHDVVGVPMERIQRLGDADNFWQMGETGPCGPCSELHIDKGPAFGPDGGPLADPAGERFLEFWNLVFMQYDQAPDGTRTPLPKPSIDTGAGLERMLMLLQDVPTIWDTDVLRPLIDQASALTGTAYSDSFDDDASFSLRVLAEHARSGTMLVNDGVFPSNEGRGYVLRRILRRAVRHAYLLGAEKLVLPELVGTAVDIMGDAYPEVRRNADVHHRTSSPRRRSASATRCAPASASSKTSWRPGAARSAAPPRSSSTTPTASRLELTAGDRRRTRRGRGRGRLQRRDERAAAPGQGGPQGRRCRRRPRRHLPRARRAVRHHRASPATRRRSPTGARVLAVVPVGDRRGAVPGPDAVLRGVGRPGRRHRGDRHAHRAGRGPRHDVRAARPSSPHRPHRATAR